MDDATIYTVKRKRDHIDRLHEIVNLARIGAAATDTTLHLEHMDAAQCTLWEHVYMLAYEAVELAELAAKPGNGG